MKVFAKEEILLHHCALGRRIDYYFRKHNLAIEAGDKKRWREIKGLKIIPNT